jgi:hypothetical protein
MRTWSKEVKEMTSGHTSNKLVEPIFEPAGWHQTEPQSPQAFLDPSRVDFILYEGNFGWSFPLANYIRSHMAGCLWLTPVILAIQEAEIRRIAVQS